MARSDSLPQISLGVQ
ncbi:hypothetical protein TNCV_3925181, partial [Trichonephila clavipes]